MVNLDEFAGCVCCLNNVQVPWKMTERAFSRQCNSVDGGAK